MRKIIILILFIVCGFVFAKNYYQKGESSTEIDYIKQKPKIIIEEKNVDLKEISFGENIYRYSIYEIGNIDDLELSVNLIEKKTGIEFFENNNCKFLTNGGFYGEDNKSVGWLQTKEKLERRIIQSSLLDGFLYYDKKLGAQIGFEVDGENIGWGLQNGPMLIFNGSKINLKINNDEENRRVFGAINNKGELIFGVVVGSDNLIFGPMLSDIPEIVEKIGKENNHNFVNAINLDGGSASAFITDKIQIRETKLVGSWLCER